LSLDLVVEKTAIDEKLPTERDIQRPISQSSTLKFKKLFAHFSIDLHSNNGLEQNSIGVNKSSANETDLYILFLLLLPC
jgi:hypothetical protein